ncbi:MAG: bifunctional oligoribonuclease/PAP phosphatase NrnA [Ruminococcus sp.]|nr:bifunctional oligoribonuclease/PAP phosphatase NrnA [Ruminococcus sp.]
MKIDFNTAADILKSCGSAYILTHQSPDGDCIGSGTALYYILRGMGKKARVLCSDEIPKKFDFMRREYTDEEFEPEIIIAADVADAKLLGRYNEIYGDKVDLCIDHHISNTGYAKNTLVCPDASAACEVVYELMKVMGIAADEKLAKCIYTGIATDTGCFRYENTTARAHEIAAELKKTVKVNFAKINREMFDVKSRGRLKMEAFAVDRIEYYLEGKCTLLAVTSKMREEMEVTPAELDGIEGIPLQVEGAEVGITIKQRDETSYKISMRSANDVNVSDICAMLGGGGHVKAAGCLLHGTLDEVKEQIVDAVKKGIEVCTTE